VYLFFLVFDFLGHAARTLLFFFLLFGPEGGDAVFGPSATFWS